MLSEEKMAINRLECGNTAHSRNADYIQLAIKALKKQVPVKPIDKIQYYYGCPICRGKIAHGQKYCDRCGQKLDWSDGYC